MHNSRRRGEATNWSILSVNESKNCFYTEFSKMTCEEESSEKRPWSILLKDTSMLHVSFMMFEIVFAVNASVVIVGFDWRNCWFARSRQPTVAL